MFGCAYAKLRTDHPHPLSTAPSHAGFRFRGGGAEQSRGSGAGHAAEGRGGAAWGAEGQNRAARPQRVLRQGRRRRGPRQRGRMRRRGPHRRGRRRRRTVPAMKEEAGVWPQPAKEGRGARQSGGGGRGTAEQAARGAERWRNAGEEEECECLPIQSGMGRNRVRGRNYTLNAKRYWRRFPMPILQISKQLILGPHNTNSKF